MPHPNQRRTLVIGEALVDVVRATDGSVTEHVGGSPLNVAMGLARLEHPSVLATHLAQDDHGRLIASLLEQEGVELTSASFDVERTSTAHATLAADGSAAYEFDLAWPAVTDLPTDVGHVHTGSIGSWLLPGAASVLSALQAASAYATVSYDPNVRPTLMQNHDADRATIEAAVAASDVVKSSDEDAEWLYPGETVEDIAKRWATMGPRLVVITRGSQGAHAVLSEDDGEIDVAGRIVTVADTVGAGDSFMSGLISGLLDARLLGGHESRRRLRLATLDDIQPALERATLTSSITVTRHGSQPPHRDEIRSR